MTGRLNGKFALITAAAAGIGRATALAFAREGASVLATDIDEVGLRSLAEQGMTTAILNVRDADAIEALVAAQGRIDILFNAAGFVHHGTILECPPEDWDRSFDLNVGSTYRTIRAVLPGMLAQGSGSIINVASAASSIKGVPNRAVYSATKAALIGLTKSVAVDFAATGVRCNAICPGTVDTPSLAGRMAAAADPAAARRDFIARQPMGRLGTAEEIAHLAVYLASDESGFTSGAALLIDGAWAA